MVAVRLGRAAAGRVACLRERRRTPHTPLSSSGLTLSDAHIFWPTEESRLGSSLLGLRARSAENSMTASEPALQQDWPSP